MSWILTYLMIGVATAWIYDFASEKMDLETRFNNKERVVIVLIWPVALAMFIWAIIKTFIDGFY